MSDAAPKDGSHVAGLRRAFDESFAALPQERAPEVDRLLAIGVGHESCTIRLAEISGLFVDRVVVPIPSPVRELSGVVGLRGEIVPVYSLGAILGQPPAAAPPRWFVLHDGVGIGFDRFDGYVDPEAGESPRLAIDLGAVSKTIRALVSAVSSKG